MAWGDVTPKVSTSAILSTWPSVATVSRSSSSCAIDERVASIGKKVTLSPFSWANFVDSIEASIARSTGHRYAFSMRWWLAGTSITTPETPQSSASWTSGTMQRENA